MRHRSVQVQGFEAGPTLQYQAALGLATGAMAAARSNSNWVFNRGNIRSALPQATIEEALNTYAWSPGSSLYAQQLAMPVQTPTRGRRRGIRGASRALRASSALMPRSARQGDLGTHDDVLTPDWISEDAGSGVWGGWSDIVSSFVAPIGEGVARLFSPEALPPLPGAAPPEKKTPMWVIPAAVGGLGLAMYLFLKK